MLVLELSPSRFVTLSLGEVFEGLVDMSATGIRLTANLTVIAVI